MDHRIHPSAAEMRAIYDLGMSAQISESLADAIGPRNRRAMSDQDQEDPANEATSTHPNDPRENAISGSHEGGRERTTMSVPREILHLKKRNSRICTI